MTGVDKIGQYALKKYGKIEKTKSDMLFGEFVAYLFSTSTIQKGGVGFDFGIAVFEDLSLIKLEDFTADTFDEIVKKHATSKNITPAKTKFKQAFVQPAIDLKLIRENLKILSGTGMMVLEDWIKNTFGEVLQAGKEMTFGEFAAYLFATEIIDKKNLYLSSKKFNLHVLNALKDIKIKDLTPSMLNESVDSYNRKITAAGKETVKTKFKKIFIVPAIDMGLTEFSYELKKDWIDKIADELEKMGHTGENSKIVGVDVCEIVRRSREKSSSSYFSSQSGLGALFNVFRNLWDKEWDSLEKEERETLAGFKTNTPGKRVAPAVIDIALERGALSDSMFSISKNESVNIDSDIWKIYHKGFIKKLDFTDIENESYKKAIKLWMEWRWLGEASDPVRAKRTIEKIFIPFLEKYAIPLPKFNNAKRKLFLLHLRTKTTKEYSEKTLKNDYKNIKQFLRFLQDNHPKLVNESLYFPHNEKLFKEDEKKRQKYEDWEIDEILRKLQGEQNRVFANIVYLLLLTGRRMEEALTLKKDCIIKIDKFSYLKYTNHKAGKEGLFPLQSNEIGGSGNLFDKDAKTLISQYIGELRELSIPMANLCDPLEKNHLILIKYRQRSKHGHLGGRLSSGLFSKWMRDFKRKHHIKFDFISHKFRHTLATKLIRKGVGIEAAARVIGNNAYTTNTYYNSDVSKHDTLHMEVSPLLNVKEDAIALAQFNNTPETIMGSEKDAAYAVPAGWCKGGYQKVKACKYYNRLFSRGGCLGCSQLGVSEENEPFYKNVLELLFEEAKNNQNTPLESGTLARISLANAALKNTRSF